MYILLVFLALGSVCAHDIIVGSSTDGKKVFDEHFQAGPAVWRQVQNVTINTTDDEVISRIVVTDLREDKDGDAKIVDGGEGQKKVTIELKSPTVLRGYDFNVEVYATPNKEYQKQKSGSLLPGDIKFDGGSLITAYSGSKITPQASGDLTTKLPEIPKTLANPTNAEAKQNNARETRDTEVKKPEDKSKIESPTVFEQKAATTAKPNNKDGNVPVSIGKKHFSVDTEDDEKATENPTSKTNRDEVRHVRDTHEDDVTTKNSPKRDSFGSQTTTATSKPPNYNLNSDITVTSHPVSVAKEGRDARTTQKGDSENVSPSLISSQRNPTVYTPNFEGHVPALAHNVQYPTSLKPTNDQSKIVNDQIRSARDTQAEIKEISTPKADDFTKPAIANKHAVNVTEERKARSTQEATSTTTPSILAQQDGETSVSSADRQSSLKPPGPLTKSQNFPVPYPYEATTKARSTTKSPFKRDANSQESKTDDDKHVKINPKSFGTSESTTEIVSATKSPHKRDTESEESKAGNINVNLNPKSIGTFETTTIVSSTTKSPFKRDIATSEESNIDDKNIKGNPKSFSTYEASTKFSSTTKSPVVESSQESQVDEKTFKVIPKAIGNQNETSHDHKVPVVSLQ